MGHFYKKKGQSKNSGGYRQNHGKPGVVYILSNDAFANGLYKIGCSSRSGAARAQDLNKDANTGTPALFSCEFEVRTLDCGLAEQRVFSELSDCRTGKRGQEYFRVDFDRAKDVIKRACAKVDQEFLALSSHKTKQASTVELGRTQRAIFAQPSSVGTGSSSRFSRTATAIQNSSDGFSRKEQPTSGFPLGKWIILFGLMWACYVAFRTEKSMPKKDIQTPNSFSQNRTLATNDVNSKPVRKARRPEYPQTTDQGGEAAAIAAIKSFGNDQSENMKNSQKSDPASGFSELTQRSVEQTPIPLPTETHQEKQNDLYKNSAGNSVTIGDLTSEEKQSLESVCSIAKYSLGPAAYNECLSRNLAAFDLAKRPRGLDGLTREERMSLEVVCSSAKSTGGPSQYNDCRNDQLSRFDPRKRPAGLSSLTADELRSMQAVCSSVKFSGGPGAYNDCMNRQMERFDPSKRPTGLSALTADESRSIQMMCSSVKYTGGPAAYYDCLNNQLEKFDPKKRPTGLSSLTADELRSLQMVCSSIKFTGGPNAYYDCINNQMVRFDPRKRPNGISSLTTDERQSLESVCSSAKYSAGPAAYNECLSRQMDRFDPRRRPIGLALLTRAERVSLESVCSNAKYSGGPAAYNECLSNHIDRLDPNSRPTNFGNR